MRKLSRLPLIAGLTLALALGAGASPFSAPHAQNAVAPTGSPSPTKTTPGQTATLLPDGIWLLIGGQGEGGTLAAAEIRDADGHHITLPRSLNQARAWHTATLLPNGTVLIVGGVDGEGKVIETAELFDPETKAFKLLTSPGPPARAYHTATLLTDGAVLIVGGLSSDGLVLRSADLWDPQTGTVTPVPAELGTPRRNQTATLLPDGKVLLWGGTDDTGEP